MCVFMTVYNCATNQEVVVIGRYFVVLTAGTQLKEKFLSFDASKVELCDVKRHVNRLNVLRRATIYCTLTV